jgi:hypothetical protein
MMCSLGEGDKIECRQLHQLDKLGQAPLDKVMIKVIQPKAINMYYAGTGKIDIHNQILTAVDGLQPSYQ